MNMQQSIGRQSHVDDPRKRIFRTPIGQNTDRTQNPPQSETKKNQAHLLARHSSKQAVDEATCSDNRPSTEPKPFGARVAQRFRTDPVRVAPATALPHLGRQRLMDARWRSPQARSRMGHAMPTDPATERQFPVHGTPSDIVFCLARISGPPGLTFRAAQTDAKMDATGSRTHYQRRQILKPPPEQG